MNAVRAERFEAMARRQTLRVIRRIVGIALFLAVCMWSFIGWSLWSEYNVARAAGQTEGYNLTAAFASELTKTFESAAAVFRLIENDVKAGPLGPGAGPGTGIDPLRRSIAAVAGPGTEVRIAGPDGHLLFSTVPAGTEVTDFSQQAHFIAHRDHSSTRLTLDPLRPEVAGKAIEVSCRLETADGRFAGEAILSLKPAILLTLNSEIDLGRRGMVAVLGNDGIVRAGFDRDHTNGELAAGTDLTGGAYPDRLDPGATATYIRPGRVDGIERLITIRALARYPLRVTVALDLDDVLGVARAHVWLICLVGAGASVLIGIMTVLLLREVWRRKNREIELAYDRDRLHSAQVQMAADRARLDKTNRELLESQEIAETANRARTQFLAHMSHELRTPLHAIIGFSELIQDQAPTKPGSPPIAGYATDILVSGRHLLELINSILDISKVESGTATLTETAVPIADLARGSLISVRAWAEAKRIAIDLRLPETTLRVRADRTRLLQVLINLMSNAVKFTPDDGQITLAAAVSDAGDLVFSVTDTGIGMTEPEIAIALEPFGQVDSTLARAFEGTGLGLPLALKLTELHGGRMEVTSIKGRGTTVNVILPAERVLHREGARV
jgi:two-component system cell cycle sensor histidine kinase PleC